MPSDKWKGPATQEVRPSQRAPRPATQQDCGDQADGPHGGYGMMATPRKETTLNPIDRSYEDLVDRGAAGIRFKPSWGSERDLFSQSTSGLVENQCERGGCHRRGETYVRIAPGKHAFLCEPCGQAVPK